jgi:hypothetical protein
MADEVPDLPDIRKEVERLLASAEVRGRLPTPVDDLVAAAGLVRPKRSMLANLVLHEAPEHLRGPIRRLRLKVDALLDREEREIHLDPAIEHPGQIAFKTLHEVAHDIFPWQTELGYADDEATLSPSMRRVFEWQANSGAAELLFQRNMFRDLAHEYAIGLAAAFDVASAFGSSRRAGLHRYAETHRSAVAGVVLEVSPVAPGQLAYRRREVVVSRKFEEQFGPARSWPRVLRSPPYTFLAECADACLTDEIVRTTMALPRVNNECQQLDVEMFSNSYNVLVLIWEPRRERGRRRVVVRAGHDS